MLFRSVLFLFGLACERSKPYMDRSVLAQRNHVHALKSKLNAFKVAIDFDNSHTSTYRREVEELERHSLSEIGAELRSAICDHSDLLSLYHTLQHFDWTSSSVRHHSGRPLEFVRYTVEKAAIYGDLTSDMRLGALFVALVDLPTYLHGIDTTLRVLLRTHP